MGHTRGKDTHCDLPKEGAERPEDSAFVVAPGNIRHQMCACTRVKLLVCITKLCAHLCPEGEC